MNIILDTHSFLWFVWNDSKFSASARSHIESPTSRNWISVASLWEIAIKYSLGKLNVGSSLDVFFKRELSLNSFLLLDINVAHLAMLSNLSFHHRDPFDRLLVAQSLSES